MKMCNDQRATFCHTKCDKKKQTYCYSSYVSHKSKARKTVRSLEERSYRELKERDMSLKGHHNKVIKPAVLREAVTYKRIMISTNMRMLSWSLGRKDCLREFSLLNVSLHKMITHPSTLLPLPDREKSTFH